MLSVGDFDERIFLGEDAEEEIGTPGGRTSSELSEQMQFKRSLKQHVEEVRDIFGFYLVLPVIVLNFRNNWKHMNAFSVLLIPVFFKGYLCH